MKSPTSIQREAFIKANEGKKILIKSKGRANLIERVGRENAGIIYDNAVKRGFAAAAASPLLKK